MTSRFRQAEIERILRAARTVGYRRVRVEIAPDGNIVAEMSDDPAEAPPRRNPLDRLLEPPPEAGPFTRRSR